MFVKDGYLLADLSIMEKPTLKSTPYGYGLLAGCTKFKVA